MVIPSDLKKWLKMRIPKCVYSNAILVYIESLEEDAGSKIAEIAQLENRIKQLEAAKPKWISVADRKPTETGSYIVCTDRNAVCTARYYAQTTFGGAVRNDYFAGKVGKHITHWMNLPEPLKGE